MRRIERILKMGSIAAGIAAWGLSWSSAANEPESGIIVLAKTNQVEPQRTTDRATTMQKLESGKPDSTVLPASTAPVFVPRIRVGAPASRVGGATRARDNAVAIRTLVPDIDEAALTMAAQPILHWHLSEATTQPVNFTLLDPERVDPIVDAMIAGPFEAGIQVLSLADYDARLEPGRDYEWFVAVVPDAENRSGDAVARGTISRITDAALASRVAQAEAGAVAGLLAQSGIWYEALDVLSRGIRQSPNDLELRAHRRIMLEQVGLSIFEKPPLIQPTHRDSRAVSAGPGP